MVLATHEMDEAERIADRVVIFDRGRRGRRRAARRAARRPRRDPLPHRATGIDLASLGCGRSARRWRADGAGEYRIDGGAGSADDGGADGVARRARAPARRRPRRRAEARGRVPPAHGFAVARAAGRWRDEPPRRAGPQRGAHDGAQRRAAAAHARHPGPAARVLQPRRRAADRHRRPDRLPRARHPRARGDEHGDGQPRHRHRLRAHLPRAQAARRRRRSAAGG